jgi:hypothetical protein
MELEIQIEIMIIGGLDVVFFILITPIQSNTLLWSYANSSLEICQRKYFYNVRSTRNTGIQDKRRKANQRHEKTLKHP